MSETERSEGVYGVTELVGTSTESWEKAARADRLLDHGLNDPKSWDAPFGSGQVHLAVSVFSDSEETWRSTMETALRRTSGME